MRGHAKPLEKKKKWKYCIDLKRKIDLEAKNGHLNLNNSSNRNQI